MRIIVSVILLAFITVSCGTNKRVYAPPFEEEETETVVVKENVQTTAQNPTKKTENTKPVVSREENVTMTHGDVLKRYNVIVGSFSKSREFQEHPQLSEALKNRLEEKFKAAEKAGIRLDLRHRDDPKKQSQDLER